MTTYKFIDNKKIYLVKCQQFNLEIVVVFKELTATNISRSLKHHMDYLMVASLHIDY